jgi:NAD(P)-dependent dehydrogenase (short-subunit alcohol dehydrogenase family)
MTGDNIESIEADSFRNILEINLISPVILNTLLIPLMNKGSSIVYVGSSLATKAVAQMTSYVTTKHAMVGLMKSTTKDLDGKFIHSACVCPGSTNTEMLRDYVGGSEEALAGLAQDTSEKRLIEPSEIASAILFCAQNPVVNGTILHTNLGAIE